MEYCVRREGLGSRFLCVHRAVNSILRCSILVKVPCECITGNIARGCGREPIKHKAQPSALFARDHAPSAIFSIMHEREQYFNWFIAAFLASAALNDSKYVGSPM